MEKVLELYKYIDGVNDAPFPSNEEQLIIGDFKYDAKRMGGAPIITFNAMHRLCLDKLWDKNVYATFNGERYFIKQTPTSSYSNTDTRYKHDVELVSERVVLDNIYFYDVVTNNHDVDKPVSNSSKFTFFGDVDEYVSRLNSSLSWSGVNYNVVIDDGVTSEEKQVTFENQIITNALQEIYNIYKIPYYFVGKTIHIGEYQDNIDHVFKYGADNSLLSISKNNSNAKIVNRITGVGSSDNIPYYYPNDDEKGVTRPLLNGSSNGVSIDNQSRYRKVRLSDTFVFHSSIQTQTPIIDSLNYRLGDLVLESVEDNKGKYSVDFYYSFTLSQHENVLFNVSTDLEDSVDLRYEIYKTSGNHLGYFSESNQLSLTGGTYNFIIRWTFNSTEVMNGVREKIDSLIQSHLNISASIVVDANNSWTLKNIPVNLYSYGLKVNNPSDGDVISIEQVSYINTQPNLMPFIYRDSEGNERFYNAINNTYKDGDGNYYIFDNEYSKNHPSEYIENFDDIKPTIKNVTNAEGFRIDSFVDFAYDLYDNDEVDENNEYIHKYFFAKLNKLDGDLGFNLFDHSIDESEMVISMTSGSCGSCSFKIMVDKDTQKNTVQVDEYGNLLRDNNGNVRFGTPQDRQNDTENNEVWIALEKDATTFGVLMPNASNRYRPIADDTFVILHIDLPKAYIVAAEKRLESKLIDFMHDNNFEKFNFSIVFSRIFFAENPSVLNNLNENAKIQVEYDGNEYSLFASSISISITSESPIPEIKVELSDNISISQNQISQIVESTKKEILSKTTKDVFWGDIKGIPSWIGSEKPKYSYSELSGKGISDDSNGLWVLKKDSKGNSYIYTNLYVVTQQGVTMYSDTSNLDLPSIYDGLLIDNDTIYWEEIKDEEGNVISKRLKAIGGSGEGGITPTLLGDLTNVGSWANAIAAEDRIMVQRKDSSSWTPLNLSEIGGGSADFSNVLYSGNGNAFTSFVLSDDKKTLTFVKGLTFAEKSDSLSGYGITDAYTKAEVDGLVEDYLPLEGGTIQGDVRLRKGNEYTSPYLYFGDGSEVYLVEETDRYLTIHADRDILLTTGSNYTAKLNGNSIATETWVTNKGYATASDLDSRISALVNGAPAAYDTLKEIADVLQGNVNSIGDIVTALGGKADKATTLAGYGITDAKISNGVITLGGSTITPLTSHQTIYNLTLQAGAFSATTFDPNGDAKTVNIPTTTSHISEGSNLYFTNARAVAALDDTLSLYVTKAGTQTITGEKDFTGGLKVNGSQIVYDKTNKYWKLTGDLLVTGGITMYANDGTYTPSTITDAVNIDNQTIIRQNGKLMVNPELLLGGGEGGEVSTVVWGDIIGKPSWITDTKPKYSYTEISGTPDLSVYALSTSLNEYQTKITESSKLPYSLVDGTPDLSIYVTKGTTLAHYGIADAKISNGVITLGNNTITPLTQTLGDARYVTALGTSGNDLTWTKNGTTNKITIPYSVKSKELSSWKVLTIKKNQDAGIIYKLIANLTNWKAGYNAQWGIIGVMYGHRGGNMSGTCIQNIVAYCASYSASGGGTNFELKTDVTSYVKPYIVSYNGVNYLALRISGSGSAREHCFLGYTENLLDEFIEVSESSVSILHETEVMSMGGIQANSSSKLETARKIWGQSFDGTSDVSGDMTGVGSLTMDGQLSLNGITIKRSASGVLFIDGNLVVSGGVTMYGTDGTTSTTIWDNAPIASTSVKGIASFDPNYFAVNNGKVTFIGSTGGGVADSVAWTNITGKPNSISGYGITDAYTKTESDGRYIKIGGSLSSNINFDNYYTPACYNNQTGDGSGNTNAPSTYGLMFVFGGDGFAAQMHLNAGNSELKTRTRYVRSGVISWTDWKTLAYQDGNIATATKLKTPRSIWGNNFDGSADIKNSNLILYKNESSYTGGWAREVESIDSSGKVIGAFGLFGSGDTFGRAFIGESYENMWLSVTPTYTHVYGRLETSQNVEVGTTLSINGITLKKSASGVLYVDGNLVVKGGVTMYGSDSTSAPSILDSLPIASTTKKGIVQFDGSDFVVSNGIVSLNGNLGLDESALASYLSTNKYLTQTSGDARYVSSFGTSGDSLTWIKNGTTNKITVPYATKATNDSDGNSINSTYLKLTGGKLSGTLNANSIVPNSNNAYSLGTTTTRWGFINTYSVNSPSYIYNRTRAASISAKGWYRIATATETNAAGTNYIFSIGREYNNNPCECYHISVSVGWNGNISFTQLSGTRSVNPCILITKFRCVYKNSGKMYFDFYYNGTSSNENIHVNGIGYMTMQSPTLTDEAHGLTGAVEFELCKGCSSSQGFIGDLNGTATTASKLSTVSKTAWGQTYWTSGGVPTSISGNMSSVGNITSLTNGTYSIGSSSNLWKDVWTGYVKFTDSMYLGFTDSYLGLRAGGSGSQLIVDSSSVRTNKTDTARASLGTISVPWAGLYLGGGSMPNVNGINFTDGSTYVVNQISGNSTGGVGIYSSGSIFFRGGCTKGTTKVTSSGTGVTIDPNGNVLATGGITMYSDLRKKTILNHVELSLKEVADAPLIEHYYNSDEAKTTHVGSVAQYWAGLNDWFCKEDGEGFLTMEIQNAALASAISVARELTRYESKTDKQIKKLKKRIGELEEEIENLKNK